jgi:putative transposase
MLAQLHSLEAHAANTRDNAPGRKVWFQFWDTQLTFERSWIARLRYTHENAVKHGLVARAADYPWCSAGWFERTANPAFVSSVKSVNIDRVSVIDLYEPVESGGEPPHSIVGGANGK